MTQGLTLDCVQPGRPARFSVIPEVLVLHIKPDGPLNTSEVVCHIMVVIGLLIGWLGEHLCRSPQWLPLGRQYTVSSLLVRWLSSTGNRTSLPSRFPAQVRSKRASSFHIYGLCIQAKSESTVLNMNRKNPSIPEMTFLILQKQFKSCVTRQVS